jgi:hypothetical protein
MPPRNTSGGDVLRKSALKDGDHQKSLGGQPIKPARGTYLSTGVRYYGRTKKRDRQKLIKGFASLPLGHHPLRNHWSIGRDPVRMYFDQNRPA